MSTRMQADVEKIAAELRAGLEGVTPGRWETFPCKSLLRPEGRIGIQSRSGPLVADCGISGNTHSIPNAAYIVAAQPENIRALLDELSRLREALKPFALVAERDIGEDEADADRFQPMRTPYNRAPLLTVGDLRAAARALSTQVEERE